MNIKLKTYYDFLMTILFNIALILLSYAFCIKYNELDYDLWSRLLMGQHVIQTGQVMYQDIISYAPVHTWYDPEWLSSALLYLATKNYAIYGLTVLKIIFIYILLATIFFSVKNLYLDKKFNYNILYFIFFLIFMRDCGYIFPLRCQFITYILLALWIFLLEKIREKHNKLLFLLPFIMLLWLNTHGGCIAGVGILFLYGVGEFLNKKPYKKYFIALFFVCLIFLINPWGIDYIKFIFDSSYLDRSWIAEWQSPFLNNFSLLHAFITYKIFMVLIFGIYLYNTYKHKITYEKIDKTKLIVLLVTTFLSYKYLKHIPLFFITGYIYFYKDIDEFLCNIYEKFCQKFEINQTISKTFLITKNIVTYLLIILFFAFTYYKYDISNTYAKSYFSNYPVQAYKFLEINDIKGKIFATFSISSYLAYKGYPNLKIYMDGRQEQVYDLKTFDEGMFFINWSGDNPDIILKKYSPEILLIETINTKLLEKIALNKKYQKIYDDERFIIYIKNSIKKFNYAKPNFDKKELLKETFKTNYNFKKDNK